MSDSKKVRGKARKGKLLVPKCALCDAVCDGKTSCTLCLRPGCSACCRTIDNTKHRWADKLVCIECNQKDQLEAVQKRITKLEEALASFRAQALPTDQEEHKAYQLQFNKLEEYFTQQQLALDAISLPSLRESRRNLTATIQSDFRVLDDIKALELKSVYVGVKTLDSLPTTPEKHRLAQTKLVSPDKAQQVKDTRGLKILL